jgi:hypothetical protein
VETNLVQEVKNVFRRTTSQDVNQLKPAHVKRMEHASQIHVIPIHVELALFVTIDWAMLFVLVQ